MNVTPEEAFGIDYTKFDDVLALAMKMAKNGPTQFIFHNGRNYQITMQKHRAGNHAIEVQSWSD